MCQCDVLNRSRHIFAKTGSPFRISTKDHYVLCTSIIDTYLVNMSKTGEEFTEGNKLNDSATFTNYSKLNEAELVEGIPIATYIPDFVKVVAPSNLPEGYQFTVLANSVRLIVAVVSNNEIKV